VHGVCEESFVTLYFHIKAMSWIYYLLNGISSVVVNIMSGAYKGAIELGRGKNCGVQMGW